MYLNFVQSVIELKLLKNTSQNRTIAIYLIMLDDENQWRLTPQ